MLKSVTQWGVKPDHKDEINRRVEFSNVIFMALPVVYIIFMIIDFRSYLHPFKDWRFDELMVPAAALLCLFFLYLNKSGLTFLSRFLFVFAWPILLHLVPISLLNTPVDYYLAYPFGIAFHAMLIQLMFSYRKEPIIFWVLICTNVVAIFFVADVLLFFDHDRNAPLNLINDEYYAYDAILYWLLFNLVTFYILFIIEDYIQRTNQSNALITRQRDELDIFNKRLEQLVKERTDELSQRNAQLMQHAHYNAHLLRGPYCRVKGLVHLHAATPDKADHDMIRIMLTESLQELDDRILEIQKIVG